MRPVSYLSASTSVDFDCRFGIPSFLRLTFQWWYNLRSTFLRWHPRRGSYIVSVDDIQSYIFWAFLLLSNALHVPPSWRNLLISWRNVLAYNNPPTAHINASASFWPYPWHFTIHIRSPTDPRTYVGRCGNFHGRQALSSHVHSCDHFLRYDYNKRTENSELSKSHEHF